MALCCSLVAACADAVDDAARRAYELTAPSSAGRSGFSIDRGPTGRVAMWQIQTNESWEEYSVWVRKQLMGEFDSVVMIGRGLRFSRSAGGDAYTLDIRPLESAPATLVVATFAARPF